MFSEIKRKIKMFLLRLKRNRKKLLISEMAALVVLCAICAAPGIAAIFANQTDTVKNQFNIIKPKPIMVSGSEFCNTIPSTATSIVFSDEAAPADASLTDVSEAQNKSVVAWLDGTTYKVSTQNAGELAIANPDSSEMFGSASSSQTGAYKNLALIDVKKLDTSIVTNMYGIFGSAGYNSSTFTIEGLSSWDTSKVTNMSEMFRYAGYKASTWNIGDLSGWDTSQVTNMLTMFWFAGKNASTFIIEGLSSWDTSNVMNMSYMFYAAGENARTWSIGDLSGWDTSKVTNMSGMFAYTGYNARTWSIGDLRGWDTSKVTNMYSMFSSAGQNARTWSIGDISSWNTSQVTDMASMFNATPATSLNLSSFDTSSVTNMGNMFAKCKKLEKVTLGNKFAWVGTNGYLPAPDSAYIDGADGKWYNEDTGTGYAPADIPSNTAATYVAVKPKPIMVSGSAFCNTIPSTATSIVFSDETAPADASLTDVSAAQNKSVVAWLDGTTYKVSTQKTGKCVIANPDSSQMFGKTSGTSTDAYRNLTAIDVQKLDTSIVTNMFGMFDYTGYNSSTFTIEGLSSWDTSKVTNMSEMFRYAGYKASTWNIGDLSGWDTSQVTNMLTMFWFAGKNASTFIIEGLSSWDTSNVMNMSYMFYAAGENARTWSIGDLSGWDTSKVTNMSGMFAYTGYNARTWSIGDLRGWDTSKVTNMYSMFSSAGQNARTWSIGDISSWNTSQVTDMASMFNATPATSLNLSSFDTSSVTNMGNMFAKCKKLEKVTLGNKFAWVGTNGYLPAPSSTYIDGADGKWYNKDTGVGYAPADIPSNTAATYVAVKPVKIVSWADGTDEEIVAMVAAADKGEINLADYWSVGDERKVNLAAMSAGGIGAEQPAQTITLVLMQQGLYELENGKTCNFIVGQKNLLTGYCEMLSSNDDVYTDFTWDNAPRRTWCNNQYYNAYPETLKPIFKQFKTITARKSGALTTSLDYFALPAEKEVFGSCTYSNANEADALTQFEYYKTTSNILKKQGDNGSKTAYWTRSPIGHTFCVVNSDGTPYPSLAVTGIGYIAPFGCI